MRSVAIIGTRGYPSYYGGFETLVRHLSPYLADLGWDVTVYSRPGATQSDVDGIDPRIKSVETPGLETKSLSTLSFGATSSLHTAFRKPDVALVMNVANGFWLPVLKVRGVPTAVNVDGIEWEREKWGANAKRVFKTGARLTARFADELIYDSNVLGARWAHDYGRKGTFIPYGGTVPDSAVVEEGLIRRKYVLVVARFVPENSIDEFLEAVDLLGKDQQVVIVGSSGYGGPTESKIRSMCARLHNLRWLGHISDDKRLFSLWQNAGAYFHGHSVGGTNPALVQAMACGAPTVARDTPFNREVLGERGRFVQPTGSEIARSIAELIGSSSLQDTLSEDGRARADSIYNWESVCVQYEELLRTLADRQQQISTPHNLVNPLTASGD